MTAMGDTPFDIHISYQRGDRDLAAALARRLEERGVATQYDAGIGAARTLAAEAGPEQARVLVILASSEAPDARELRRELAAADRLARPVVTLLLEDIEPKGATLQALADRIWVRAHPEPIARIDEIVELLATLAGKGTPRPAPWQTDLLRDRRALPKARERPPCSATPRSRRSAPAPRSA